MTIPTFFSDRAGLRPRGDFDVLPEATSKGLLSLVGTRINSNWFAEQFPVMCHDGNGVTGTDVASLRDNIHALISSLALPFERTIEPKDEDVLDLVEYAARTVSKPSNGKYHEFLRHHELTFDAPAGRAAFREEVNLILSRGGTSFELDKDGLVRRTGVEGVQAAVAGLQPSTGDATLDALIIEARSMYQSRDHSTRKIGLEKLWDALERLKSIDDPSGKKPKSIAILLAHFAPDEWRDCIEVEMKALTDFGNKFAIRHHDTTAVPVPQDSEDFLFTRLSNLITLLLRGSGRLQI